MTLPAVQEVPDLDLNPTVACKNLLHKTFAAKLCVAVVLSPKESACCDTDT